jgi:CelD/BcsL family acetyltransferase involved in cellulose biosynthesis
VDITYTDSFDEVSPGEWRHLAERAGHVFATREWLHTWWRHYGKRDRPMVGVARTGDNAVAIVALNVWQRHGLPILRFVGHGPSDQLGPICALRDDPTAADATAALLGAIPLRRFFLIAEHVAGDWGFGELSGAHPLYRESSPVVRLGHVSWEEFLQSRGRNFRQQARRFPRKLASCGPVSYRLADDAARLDRDLDLLFELHRNRWEGADTPFLQASAFHREFAAQALAQGWLRLWFLEVGHTPVAALYGFRFAGAESAYQAGRDPAFEGGVPVGFVLLVRAVSEALADGVDEYRLLRGGGAYKHRFATSDPGLETFGLPRGRSARLLLAVAEAARGRSLGLRRLLDRT